MQCYRRNEQEKQAYDQRVREIEHGSFSQLVFTTTGGMGTIATVFYKQLAAMIAEKHERPYSKTMQWIRCRLNFSLLRSAIMCLRGSCSSRYHPSCHHISGGSIDLACAVGRVPIQVWTVLLWNQLYISFLLLFLSLDVSLYLYCCPSVHLEKEKKRKKRVLKTTVLY